MTIEGSQLPRAHCRGRHAKPGWQGMAALPTMASIRGSNATACGSASAARRPPLRSSRASLYVTRHKYSLIFIRTTSDLQLPTGKSISAHHAQLLGLRRRSWRRPSTNSAITGSRIYRSERVVTSSSSDCSAERPMGMARRRNSWRCLVKATAADNSCCKTTADSSLAPKGNVVRCTRMFRSLDSTSCGKNSATLAARRVKTGSSIGGSVKP
mmetsp:Transcript_13114/g.36628  ORF Transcript_13114/g.36628 Transcript_13114/m.36628 type:complete len:212 (+) Transcript_13114:27-662(+)